MWAYGTWACYKTVSIQVIRRRPDGLFHSSSESSKDLLGIITVIHSCTVPWSDYVNLITYLLDDNRINDVDVSTDFVDGRPPDSLRLSFKAEHLLSKVKTEQH